jgi:hypothetical protein
MSTRLCLPAILVALQACVLPCWAHRDPDPETNLVMPYVVATALIDRSSMTNKVLCGYQGWFLCPGDGSASWWGWNHWSKQSDYLGPGTYNTEIWPDTREYDASDLFPVSAGTTLTYGGTPVLFSSARQGAVNVHFRWMQENGIDGVFHQIFVGGYNVNPNDDVQRKLDTVLQNVMNAANTYGRVFAVEYDISGVADADIYNKLTGHWTYVNNAFDIKNHPRYLYHKGKPVVVIWGFGFNDTGHPGTTTTANSVITWFKNNGCFVIGGVPGKWRTLDGDSRSGTAWRNTYRAFNGITPWTVGRYSSASEITAWKSRVSADITACNTYGQLYMPTAWPRFGWDNMNAYPCGQSKIDSRQGQHFWDQLYAWKSAGATCQFIAMFDEYDESTAIMKLTDNVPTTGCWWTTEGKGEDWYLRLANWASRMQRGEIPVSQTIPISSSTSPDNATIVTDTIPATMNAGQSYSVSVTVKNTGETCWNAEFFKLAAVGDSDPFATARQLMPSGTTVKSNQTHTFGFTMTAPATTGTYTSDWRMVHEVIRWFGGASVKTVTVVAVDRADQGIGFPDPGAQYTTNVVTLSATATSGLAVVFGVADGPAQLAGATLTFTNAGTVSVVASQPGNGNWNAAVPVTNTFNVTKAAAGVTLAGLSQAYDGTAKAVTVTTVPGGLSVAVTYNGSTGSPTNAGSYAVTGTVGAAEAMYQGQATGTLVVARAASGTAVSSSQNPSVYGDLLIFTATVTGIGGTPAGTVQFKTNGVNFGSAVTLSGGQAASASVSTLPVGNTPVTAVYSGDANFNDSASAVLSQTVTGSLVIEGCDRNDPWTLLSWTGATGSTYTVEFTLSLAPLVPWTNLPGCVSITGVNGLMNVTDTNPAAATRFYRVKRIP